ncbi:MAG: Wzz/FepE/Etk N-terminal domain-containing protein [Porticoccaceae bacterium]|nr:Wzz/FepE/Etk N-terminal domain-containing protein [Porticoccaceae bacterium]
MQNDMHLNQPVDEEIDLRELASVIWAGKKIILTVTSLFAITALIVVLLIPNQYQATAVVSPAQSGGASILGDMSSQLGGLASLAGIKVPSDEGGEAQAAIEIMQSWSFIEKFIKTNNLSAELFAANGWDRETNSLSYDSSLYDSQQKNWVRTPPAGKTIEPTSWELYETFSKRLQVITDKTTGMISISIEYYSPILAQQWVGLYINTVNDYMRSRKLQQANSNIEYLEAQIEKTAIAGMKEVFYQVIEEQIKNKMLAEASPEYAFVTVSPAMVPEEKSTPKRALICVLAVLLGAMISIFAVLVMHYGQQPKSNRSPIES